MTSAAPTPEQVAYAQLDRANALQKKLDAQSERAKQAEAALSKANEATEHWADRAQRAESLLAETQEHEKQTHIRLGRVLGSYDSLEQGAKRMRNRAIQSEQGWEDERTAYAQLSQLYEHTREHLDEQEWMLDTLLREHHERMNRRAGYADIFELVKADLRADFADEMKS